MRTATDATIQGPEFRIEKIERAEDCGNQSPRYIFHLVDAILVVLGGRGASMRLCKTDGHCETPAGLDTKAERKGFLLAVSRGDCVVERLCQRWCVREGSEIAW